MEQSKLYQQAQALDVCARLRGNESPEELMRLFFTPQGVEFCTKNSFPDIETVRTFKGEMAEAFGIYIDAEAITLTNPTRVALFGNTRATLEYDDPTTAHHVITMHGASAAIQADNYAVVFTTGENITHTTKGNAKVL